MIDLTSFFYTAAASYDSRRSGSGAISRPDRLGQPFPSPHRRPYVHGAGLSVAEVTRRVYGTMEAPARQPALAVIAETTVAETTSSKPRKLPSRLGSRRHIPARTR